MCLCDNGQKRNIYKEAGPISVTNSLLKENTSEFTVLVILLENLMKFRIIYYSLEKDKINVAVDYYFMIFMLFLIYFYIFLLVCVYPPIFYPTV